MAQILAYIVGDWGATFVNIGLIISVLGCMARLDITCRRVAFYCS